MSDWLEAERRVERAQQLFESQRWEEALSELDVALSINPNNATWHAQRGFLLEELDRSSEAADAYQHSLEIEPGDRDVSMALGLTLLRLSRFAQAITVLDAVSKQYPNFEPAFCYRIHAYAELGQHDRAEQMFYLAQQLDDQCPHCFFYLGASLFSRSDHQRALFCWQRVLELEPDYVGVHERIGLIHRLQGELDQARECFLKELRNDPGNVDLLFDLGQLHVQAGDLGAAVVKFTQIVELEPDHAEAHFALARVWLHLGQPPRAIACLEDIRRLGAETEPAGFHLVFGQALLEAGRHADACPELQLATAELPEIPQSWTLMGDCYAALQKYSGAADCYRRVLAHDAKNAIVEFKLGVCLFRVARADAAIPHWLNAVELQPDLVVAWNHLAVAYLQLARWSEAKRSLDKALKLEPTNKTLLELRRRFWRYRLQHLLKGPVRFVRGKLQRSE